MLRGCVVIALYGVLPAQYSCGGIGHFWFLAVGHGCELCQDENEKSLSATRHAPIAVGHSSGPTLLPNTLHMFSPCNQAQALCGIVEPESSQVLTLHSVVPFIGAKRKPLHDGLDLAHDEGRTNYLCVYRVCPRRRKSLKTINARAVRALTRSAFICSHLLPSRGFLHACTPAVVRPPSFAHINAERLTWSWSVCTSHMAHTIRMFARQSQDAHACPWPGSLHSHASRTFCTRLDRVTFARSGNTCMTGACPLIIRQSVVQRARIARICTMSTTGVCNEIIHCSRVVVASSRGIASKSYRAKYIACLFMDISVLMAERKDDGL